MLKAASQQAFACTYQWFGMRLRLLCVSPMWVSLQEDTGMPMIMDKHLQEALGKARPSVPPAERRRLEAVYDKFSHNRDTNIADHKGKGKQIATLA